MSWSGRTPMVALTVIVSVVIASAASSCGDVGSGSAGEGPSVHAPEELLAALLVTSDIPGSTGGQGIAASSYDSTFDFSPCDAADDLAYHRVPQAETELRSDAAVRDDPVEPREGIEPSTFSLRVKCSTD
jgi:hypothetical protein